MQAIPDSTQCDTVSGEKKEKKKKATKKKKRKAEGKDSKTVKKKKTGKGRSKSSAKRGDSAEDPDLDLSIELKPIGDYIKDRDEMLDQMFACIQTEKLTAMMPSVLQGIPLAEVKNLCLTELEGMSKKRIRYIIAGQEMLSSSGTDESDSEAEAAPTIEDEDSPSNQMADSTSNLQASDNQLEHSIENQSDHSYESGGGSPGMVQEEMEQEYEYAEEEEEAVYEGSEQEYIEEQVEYQSDDQGEEEHVEEEQVEEEYMEHEGEGSDTQYEQVEDQYEEAEMEYIEEGNEEDVEGTIQEPDADDIADDETAPDESVDQENEQHTAQKRAAEDDVDNDDKHHKILKRTDQDDVDEVPKTQHVDEEGNVVADDTEEKVANVVIDVPKRMRKDVDEADVEEGEVFDDDEEEVQRADETKDGTAEGDEATKGGKAEGEEMPKTDTTEREESIKDGMIEKEEVTKDGTAEREVIKDGISEEEVTKDGTFENVEVTKEVPKADTAMMVEVTKDDTAQREEATCDGTTKSEEVSKDETAQVEVTTDGTAEGEETKVETAKEMHDEEAEKDRSQEITTTQEVEKDMNLPTNSRPIAMETAVDCKPVCTTEQDVAKTDDLKPSGDVNKDSPSESDKVDTLAKRDEISMELGKEDVVKHDGKDANREDTVEQDKVDIMEQGKLSSSSIGTEQNPKNIVKNDTDDSTVEGFKGDTLDQGNQEYPRTMDQGQEVKEQGQEVKAEVKVEDSDKTERNEDQLVQVSGENENLVESDAKSEIVFDNANVISHAEISQSGNITDCKIVTDDTSQSGIDSVDTSGKSLESVVTSVADAQQISCVKKDVCVDTEENDQKGALRHMDPNVQVVTDGTNVLKVDVKHSVDQPGSVDSGVLNENVIASETAKEIDINVQNVNISDKSANNVSENDTENIVTMDQTAGENCDEQKLGDVDKTDAMSINASESGSESDSAESSSSSSSDDAVEEEVEGTVEAAEVEAQPGSSEELEMLELELRARAIRSLMKKMGKD